MVITYIRLSFTDMSDDTALMTLWYYSSLIVATTDG